MILPFVALLIEASMRFNSPPLVSSAGFASANVFIGTAPEASCRIRSSSYGFRQTNIVIREKAWNVYFQSLNVDRKDGNKESVNEEPMGNENDDSEGAELLNGSLREGGNYAEYCIV